MEIHSYHGSVDPLWNSTAMMCPSAKPLPAVLPAVPSCDIKPALLLAMRGQHGRKAAWRVRQAAAMEGVHSYGKPQLRRLHRSAMEFHGHGGRPQLWNSAAMVRVHCYGIPELVQTDNGVEFTQRFPSRSRVQSTPVASRFTHISCITALSVRPQWHEPGRVSAQDLRFSLLV
jgi:hypothetical protein